MADSAQNVEALRSKGRGSRLAHGSTLAQETEAPQRTRQLYEPGGHGQSPASGAHTKQGLGSRPQSNGTWVKGSALAAQPPAIPTIIQKRPATAEAAPVSEPSGHHASVPQAQAGLGQTGQTGQSKGLKGHSQGKERNKEKGQRTGHSQSKGPTTPPVIAPSSSSIVPHVAVNPSAPWTIPPPDSLSDTTTTPEEEAAQGPVSVAELKEMLAHAQGSGSPLVMSPKRVAFLTSLADSCRASFQIAHSVRSKGWYPSALLLKLQQAGAGGPAAGGAAVDPVIPSITATAEAIRASSAVERETCALLVQVYAMLLLQATAGEEREAGRTVQGQADPAQSTDSSATAPETEMRAEAAPECDPSAPLVTSPSPSLPATTAPAPSNKNKRAATGKGSSSTAQPRGRAAASKQSAQLFAAMLCEHVSLECALTLPHVRSQAKARGGARETQPQGKEAGESVAAEAAGGKQQQAPVRILARTRGAPRVPVTPPVTPTPAAQAGSAAAAGGQSSPDTTGPVAADISQGQAAEEVCAHALAHAEWLLSLLDTLTARALSLSQRQRQGQRQEGWAAVAAALLTASASVVNYRVEVVKVRDACEGAGASEVDQSPSAARHACYRLCLAVALYPHAAKPALQLSALQSYLARTHRSSSGSVVSAGPPPHPQWWVTTLALQALAHCSMTTKGTGTGGLDPKLQSVLNAPMQACLNRAIDALIQSQPEAEGTVGQQLHDGHAAAAQLGDKDAAALETLAALVTRAVCWTSGAVPKHAPSPGPLPRPWLSTQELAWPQTGGSTGQQQQQLTAVLSATMQGALLPAFRVLLAYNEATAVPNGKTAAGGKSSAGASAGATANGTVSKAHTPAASTSALRELACALGSTPITQQGVLVQAQLSKAEQTRATARMGAFYSMAGHLQGAAQAVRRLLTELDSQLAAVASSIASGEGDEVTLDTVQALSTQTLGVGCAAGHALRLCLSLSTQMGEVAAAVREADQRAVAAHKEQAQQEGHGQGQGRKPTPAAPQPTALYLQPLLHALDRSARLLCALMAGLATLTLRAHATAFPDAVILTSGADADVDADAQLSAAFALPALSLLSSLLQLSLVGPMPGGQAGEGKGAQRQQQPALALLPASALVPFTQQLVACLSSGRLSAHRHRVSAAAAEPEAARGGSMEVVDWRRWKNIGEAAGLLDMHSMLSLLVHPPASPADDALAAVPDHALEADALSSLASELARLLASAPALFSQLKLEYEPHAAGGHRWQLSGASGLLPVPAAVPTSTDVDVSRDAEQQGSKGEAGETSSLAAAVGEGKQGGLPTVNKASWQLSAEEHASLWSSLGPSVLLQHSTTTASGTTSGVPAAAREKHAGKAVMQVSAEERADYDRDAVLIRPAPAPAQAGVPVSTGAAGERASTTTHPRQGAGQNKGSEAAPRAGTAKQSPGMTIGDVLLDSLSKRLTSASSSPSAQTSAVRPAAAPLSPTEQQAKEHAPVSLPVKPARPPKRLVGPHVVPPPYVSKSRTAVLSTVAIDGLDLGLAAAAAGTGSTAGPAASADRKSAGKSLSVAALARAAAYWQNKGFRALVFVPDTLLHSASHPAAAVRADNMPLLVEMQSKNVLVAVPAADYADAYILRFAQRHVGTLLCSNSSTYRSWLSTRVPDSQVHAAKDWLACRQVHYALLHSTVSGTVDILPDPSLPWPASRLPSVLCHTGRSLPHPVLAPAQAQAQAQAQAGAAAGRHTGIAAKSGTAQQTAVDVEYRCWVRDYMVTVEGYASPSAPTSASPTSTAAAAATPSLVGSAGAGKAGIKAAAGAAQVLQRGKASTGGASPAAPSPATGGGARAANDVQGMSATAGTEQAQRQRREQQGQPKDAKTSMSAAAAASKGEKGKGKNSGGDAPQKVLLRRPGSSPTHASSTGTGLQGQGAEGGQMATAAATSSGSATVGGEILLGDFQGAGSGAFGALSSPFASPFSLAGLGGAQAQAQAQAQQDMLSGMLGLGLGMGMNSLGFAGLQQGLQDLQWQLQQQQQQQQQSWLLPAGLEGLWGSPPASAESGTPLHADSDGGPEGGPGPISLDQQQAQAAAASSKPANNVYVPSSLRGVMSPAIGGSTAPVPVPASEGGAVVPAQAQGPYIPSSSTQRRTAADGGSSDAFTPTFSDPHVALQQQQQQSDIQAQMAALVAQMQQLQMQAMWQSSMGMGMGGAGYMAGMNPMASMQNMMMGMYYGQQQGQGQGQGQGDGIAQDWITAAYNAQQGDMGSAAAAAGFVDYSGMSGSWAGAGPGSWGAGGSGWAAPSVPAPAPVAGPPYPPHSGAPALPPVSKSGKAGLPSLSNVFALALDDDDDDGEEEDDSGPEGASAVAGQGQGQGEAAKVAVAGQSHIQTVAVQAGGTGVGSVAAGASGPVPSVPDPTRAHVTSASTAHGVGASSAASAANEHEILQKLAEISTIWHQ